MKESDKLREHSFDGIQEYDNDLPRWWLWLFYITIMFSLIYPFIFDFRSGQFASETIDHEMEVAKQAKQSAVSNQPAVTEQLLLQAATNQQALTEGQNVFATRCLACHGDKGQGVIGPNLTDEYWIHGGTIVDIHKVVSNGVLEKGMLAWKDQLTAEQLNAVVAYVWNLHGTNPPNPKQSEGEKVAR